MKNRSRYVNLSTDINDENMDTMITRNEVRLPNILNQTLQLRNGINLLTQNETEESFN
jgi:hypothetical protein